MSLVVIDVGSAKYGGDQSVPALIDQFEPDLLLALDPSTTADEEPAIEWVGDTTIVRLRVAAWTGGGVIGFTGSTLGGTVDPDAMSIVPCIDLASLILAIPPTYAIVLKMDCEGAEYTLVPHLRERDADLRLRLCAIEWHCATCGYGIWNWEAEHPGNGCRGDRDEWQRRRDEHEAMLRCDTTGWNL